MAKQRPARVHLNTHVLLRNAKAPGAEAPPIAAETPRARKGYAHAVELRRGDRVFARVSYDPQRPAGERCLIEAFCEVVGVLGAHRFERGAEVLVQGARIRSNLHAAAREPVLLVRAPGSSGAAAPAFEVSLLDDAAAVVAQVVYRPAQPLPCGAQVWLESHLELTFHDQAGAPCLPVTFKDLKHKESSHG